MSTTALPLSPEAAAILADVPFMSPAEVTPIDGGAHWRYSGIEYARVLGYRPLQMELLVPKLGRRVPVVLYVHAGAWLVGSHREHDRNAPTRQIWDSLLRRGIAVASVQYRLSGEAVFPACLHDCMAAVRWLRRFGPEVGVRADRIGTWGSSAGGFLSTFLAMNVADPGLRGSEGVGGEDTRVQAAVGWYGPSDFTTKQAQALPGVSLEHDTAGSPDSIVIGAAIRDHADLARWASPRTYANRDAAPTLLVQGELDHIVPAQQSKDFAASLVAAGAECQLLLIPGAGHSLKPLDPTEHVEVSAAFLAERLGPD